MQDDPKYFIPMSIEDTILLHIGTGYVKNILCEH